MVGPLLLKNLEQNAVEQGQVSCFKSAATLVHAHARRRVPWPCQSRRRPTGHDRQCTAATTSPTGSTRHAQGHWTVTAPPSQSRRRRTPRAEHHLAGPYLDSCGRRVQWSWLLPHSTRTYKGAGAHRRARAQDLDVQRHRGSPLRPRGELRCQPCFPDTQTSRHLR
jgi:hypothetical protein